MRKLLNKVAKWRTFFASWQLGTRSDMDAECRALKHHLEMSIFLRIEVSALTSLLISKGVFTQKEWESHVIAEAAALDTAYEDAFPGFHTTEMGLRMDLPEAAETMRKLNFRP